MRPLHVLMPMAGQGSRFAREGVLTPKPLIEVDGVPMCARALSFFESLGLPFRLTLVSRALSGAEKKNLEATAKGMSGDAEVLVLPGVSKHSVESSLFARERIRSDEALVVLDCDLWFRSASFGEAIRRDLAWPCRGGFLCYFEASSPRYSYLELGKNGVVTRTAEKRPISSHAVAGCYYFSTGEGFLTAAERLLNGPVPDPALGELYHSQLYNQLIADGREVRAYPTDEFRSFGTPEELRELVGQGLRW